MILFYFQLIQYTEYNLAHRGLDLAIIIRILLLYLYNLHKIAVPKQSDSFIHSHTGVRCFHKYKYQVLSCPYFYKHKFVILNINLTQILLSYSLLVLFTKIPYLLNYLLEFLTRKLLTTLYIGKLVLLPLPIYLTELSSSTFY